MSTVARCLIALFLFVAPCLAADEPVDDGKLRIIIFVLIRTTPSSRPAGRRFSGPRPGIT